MKPNIRIAGREIGEERRRLCGCLLVWLLIALLRGVFYYLTPLQLDDWQFMAVYRSHNGGDDTFSVSAWLAYMAELRQNDNSRIGNLLSPLSTLWSPWKEIFPWLTGMVCATVMLIASRMAWGRQTDWRGAAVMWLLLSVLLPWRDSMAVRDYALNYVWGAAVTLACVTVIVKSGQWLRSAWGLAGGIALIVIGGGWHEGFVIPSLCGLGVVMMLKRFAVGWRWWLLMALYAVSGAVMTLSPGTLSRAGSEFGGGGVSLIRLGVDLFSVMLLVGSAVLFSLFRRGRKWLAAAVSDDFFVVLATASVTGAMFPFLFNYTPRVCFWADLCGVTAAMRLYSGIWAAMKPMLKSIAGAAALAMCAAHGIYVCVWQSRFFREAEEVRSQLLAQGGGTVYRDVIPAETVSALTLLYPSRLMWVTPFNMACMGRALDMGMVAVVPAGLRGATFEGARKTSGDSDVGVWNGYVIADPAAREEWADRDGEHYLREVYGAEVTMADSTRVEVFPVPMIYFRNCTGDTLLYLRMRGVDGREIAGIKVKKQ